MPACTLCNLIETASVDPDVLHDQTAEQVSRNLHNIGVTLHASSIKRHRQAGHEGEPVNNNVNRELNILTLDIERIKGIAYPEFWSLDDFKNRRISPDDVADWPRTICVAWKWLEGTKHFASEWADGQQGMHEKIWEAVDKADAIIGHNAHSFDMKHLNTGWRENQLPPPTSYNMIDTLKIARQRFGDESKTLDALCQRVGVTGKTDRYNHQMALQAVDGDPGAQQRLKSYNQDDVEATEALYLELLPWIKSHPHVAPIAGANKTTCPRCGSEQVARNGSYTAAVNKYCQYTCGTCGGHFRANFEARGPSVRTL